MRWLVAILLLIWSTVASAQTKLVAVLEFRGIGMDPQMMMQLSEVARGGARSALPNTEYNITSRESMKSMLEDMGKDLSDCNVECEVELGRVLQSDYVISGTIGKIDDMYILTLKLHDTLTGSLMGQKTLRDTDKFVLLDKTGPETKALVVENIALVSNQLTGKKVSVVFKSNQFNSKTPTTILVGSTPVGSCSTASCTKDVPPGRFNVQFIQEGYAPENQTLDLRADESFTISLRASFATLSIVTEPTKTNIRLEGPEGFETITSTQFNKKRLDIPGKYTATVQDECFEPSGKYITVNPGDVKEQLIPLQPKQAGISVVVLNAKQEPVPADLIIGGTNVGTAPWQGAIPLCIDQLTVKYAGRKKVRRIKGELTEREIKEIEIQLN